MSVRYVFAGIWFSPNAESSPVLTLFGSTNLNSRSAHLDTELSFVMLANSVTVQKKLQLELQGLNKFAEDWKGDQRHVPIVTKMLARLLSGYL
jgi:CDP-diacylglycerol--glycerol-3-phosphate 3-phosphatidyltransferase